MNIDEKKVRQLIDAARNLANIVENIEIEKKLNLGSQVEFSIGELRGAADAVEQYEPRQGDIIDIRATVYNVGDRTMSIGWRGDRGSTTLNIDELKFAARLVQRNA